MTFRLKITFLFVALMVVSGSGRSAQNRSVSGSVVDCESGDPVFGAAIIGPGEMPTSIDTGYPGGPEWLMAVAKGASATTDESGRFEIELQGPSRLKVVALGYVTVRLKWPDDLCPGKNPSCTELPAICMKREEAGDE